MTAARNTLGKNAVHDTGKPGKPGRTNKTGKSLEEEGVDEEGE